MTDVEHDLEDNYPEASFIMQWRIYDVLMAIYSNMNEEEASKLVQLHDQGIFVTPPPSYRLGDDDEV